MKRIARILLLVVLLSVFAGCGNQQFLDTTYTYNYAMLKLPNGEIIEGKLDSWRDYEGDSIQIVIGGNTYYAHMENVVLTTRNNLD